MPKSTDRNLSPDAPDANPSVNPKTKTVDPSAPTVGTEGWGNTSDERRALDQNSRAKVGDGKTENDSGDRRAADAQRAERSASPSASKQAGRRDEDVDQADLSRRTSASAFSMNNSQGGSANTYRCADAGNSDCRWETSGGTEDEIMQRVEEHGRMQHGLSDWTDALRNKVKNSIRRREAA